MKKLVGLGRRALYCLAGLALSATLVACGGGGGSAGTPVIGGGGGGGGGSTPSTVADLSVVLDKTSVSNSGTDTVTVTVTSVDANRAVVGSVPIKFAVDSGAVVTPGGTSTNATTGLLSASIQIGADRSSRTISITVSTGSISKKVTFDVVDSVSGSKVADLSMVLDRSTIPNTGTQAVKVTITSLDASRSAIGGAPLTFKITDTGDAFINASGQTKTDATTGQLAATVHLGTARSNRTISVTATSGTVTRTVTFDVVDPILTTPKASDISLLLDKTNVGNSGSDAVSVTVTAVDASRNVVAGIPVTFTVDNKATVAASAATTNAQGQVTAVVQIGDDRSNRLITVTAKSDALTRTATFQVTGAKLQGTALPTLPAAGSAGNKLEYRLSDVNQNAMVGVAYSVSGGGLPPASGTTDSNGSFVYVYTAPTTAGPIDITAVAGGAKSVLTVTVPSSSSTVPVATPAVTSKSLAAAPNVVRVNATDTANRAEIRALFLAANNAPVKNIRVRFDLNGDANSIGGTLSSGSAVVYSDAAGIALTNYTPATRASPTDGVSIRACWDYADFDVATCPNQILTSLTVVSDPLSITIGQDNGISDGPSGLTYVKKFVLLVVDAAGNPKSDVQITPSLDLTYYIKGRYRWVGDEWVWGYVDATKGTADDDTTWMRAGDIPFCYSEDLNRNGLIDVGEDYNRNGQLDPRKSDASISMVGGTKTDANGTAVLKLEYPKSHASWVAFRITAAAAGVLSPPAVHDGILPVSAAAITAEPPPPFYASPYGRRKYVDLATSCIKTD